MVLVLISGFIISVHLFTWLVMSKWAGQHALCLVQNPQFLCEKKTVNELQNFFALQSVKVHAKTIRGTVHTEIEGRLLDRSVMRARYDLLASEYKRVDQK